MAVTVQNLASLQTRTSETSSVLTVGAPVAVGEHVVIRACLRLGSTQWVTGISDTRGNTYQRDAGPSGASSSEPHASVWSARITTALQTNDTITLTYSGSDRKAIAADRVAGLADSAWVDVVAEGVGSSITPSASLVPTAGGRFLLGCVGVNGPSEESFTEDSDLDGGVAWSTLTRVGTSGASATSNVTNNGAAKELSASGATYTYNPTLGTSQLWREVFVVYKVAATGDTTPPVTTLGNQTRTTISRVPGWDAFDVTISADEPFVEYELRRVPAATSTRTEGSQIETAVVTSTTSLVVTVTDDELVNALASEGENTVKAFTKDAAGNWST